MFYIGGRLLEYRRGARPARCAAGTGRRCTAIPDFVDPCCRDRIDVNTARLAGPGWGSTPTANLVNKAKKKINSIVYSLGQMSYMYVFIDFITIAAFTFRGVLAYLLSRLLSLLQLITCPAFHSPFILRSVASITSGMA
jgi:hypothetical protein